jgi:hypothetical protein
MIKSEIIKEKVMEILCFFSENYKGIILLIFLLIYLLIERRLDI